MGHRLINVEAVIVRHVAVNGKDKGAWIELEIEGQPKLAEELEVNYNNMVRRIKESQLLKLEGNVLKLKKKGTV